MFDFLKLFYINFSVKRIRIIKPYAEFDKSIVVLALGLFKHKAYTLMGDQSKKRSVMLYCSRTHRALILIGKSYGIYHQYMI